MADIITKNEIDKAFSTLQEYKASKKNLESRIIANNEWYKQRHYKQIEGSGTTDDTASAWLFNSIANKHADAMDNTPEACILPREESDKQAASMLSSVIPVVLERNGFDKVYNQLWWSKLNGGTGVYGVFWDSTKNGLGDISIREIDVLNLFWESGINDIQSSHNVYHVELWDNDTLVAMYPDLVGKLGDNGLEISKYIYDDAIDTKNKTPVVDWYYKKRIDNKDILHFCKFCNGVILFSSENDPKFANGWYNHGKYPFVFDTLFSDKGTPCGFGYIDIMKDAQKQIDLLDDNLIKYSKIATTPRYFINSSGSVNEEEFADINNSFVHVSGSNFSESIKPMEIPTLPAIYEAILNNKINELKETSGNRDFSQGSTSSGVTAASAIAALQEAGSKLSRDMIKGSYMSYKEVTDLVIELIRQFYDNARTFRIVAPDGIESFVAFDNSGIKPQNQGNAFGVELGNRLPIFDIDVKVQKSSPYAKQSQNNLALQFYQMGFFNPQNADVTLATLAMMDFDGKDGVIATIRNNGLLYDKLMQMTQTAEQLAAIVDSTNGTNISQQLIASTDGQAPNTGKAVEIKHDNSLIGQAKSRVADSTQPK